MCNRKGTLYNFILCFVLLIVSSCDMGKLGKISGGNAIGEPAPVISSVQIVNDQIIVTGSNLASVTDAQISGSATHNFEIESATSSQLTLNARSALSLLVAGLFDLTISNASGAAVFPLTFTLQDGQVTAQKLNDMGATPGQILKFNGTTWAPASATSSQIYAGVYDASTDSPDIVAAGGPAGTFYIVSTAGTQDLGSGPLNFSVGDWAIFDGTSWSRIPLGSNAVSSFNGRTGVVVPLANDYAWDMLQKTSGKLTGSSIGEIADVDVTGLANGYTLKWQTNKWIVGPETVITSGSITSTEIADGTVATADLGTSSVTTTQIADGTIVNADVSATAAIAQAKIANLVTDLAAKENAVAAGTSAQYYRGDKSWQTLNTANVPELTNLYFTEARVRSTPLAGYAAGTAIPLAPTDTVMDGFAKLEGQIIALGSSGQWTKSGSDIYYNSGNVGIGLANPAYKLDVNGDVRIDQQLRPKTYTTATTTAIANPGSALSGLFFPANHVTAFSTNGAESLRISSTGNIGVGVASPSSTLHLKAGSATANTAPLKLTSGPTLTAPEAGAIEFDGTNLYFTNNTPTRLTIATNAGGSYTGVSSISGSGALTIAAGGTNQNLTLSGSGTGSVTSASPVSITNVTNSTSATTGAMVVSGGVGVSGNVVSNTAFLGPLGSATAVSHGFIGDVDTGMFSPGANILAFATNLGERMRIDATGNVGIGAAPTAKLDVQGGAIRSVSSTGSSHDNNSTAVDWSRGNNQSMSVDCTATTFTNMLDGATYNLLVTEVGNTQCAFSQAGLSFYYTPANSNRLTGMLTLYSFTRIGTRVVVSWNVLN